VELLRGEAYDLVALGGVVQHGEGGLDLRERNAARLRLQWLMTSSSCIDSFLIGLH
jgi:hypothetical protein